MRIWFRYFDRPWEKEDLVQVEEGASVAELCCRLEEHHLRDPDQEDLFLSRRDIDIWQLNNSVKVPLGNDDVWEAVVKGCNGRLEDIATKVRFGVLDRFNTRRPDDEYLSLVVAKARAPVGPVRQGQEEDDLGSLTIIYPRRYQAIVDYQNSGNTKTPSQAADSASFRESQGKDFPIYDGRHPGNKGPNLALPVSLYHPIFQKWLDWASDQTLNPPARVIAATAELMRRASILYTDEATRTLAIRGPLQNALRHGVNTGVNDDLTTPDGRISARVELNGNVCNVPILINEEKRGSASSKADASTQASFSMLRTWAFPDLDDFRNLACCPTFLFGLSECHLVICGAVLTDKCIVNRLAMLWVGRNSTHDEDNTIKIARVFYALSLAIDALSGWYQSLVATDPPLFAGGLTNHSRFFPYATRYPVDGEDFDAGVVEFEYLQPLQAYPTCTTFLAETKPTGRLPKALIVVKFVQRYCPEVHHLLSARGMAPNLLYCGQIDKDTSYADWKLVVMDFFEGEPSFTNDRHKEPGVRMRVAEIVGVAHENDFVLGDIRPPNVLIKADGEIKLIDFDWSGREGVTCYPAHMSTGLWVGGVEPMGLIKKTHDEQMIDKWFE